jgi:hypothetical protein
MVLFARILLGAMELSAICANDICLIFAWFLPPFALVAACREVDLHAQIEPYAQQATFLAPQAGRRNALSLRLWCP